MEILNTIPPSVSTELVITGVFALALAALFIIGFFAGMYEDKVILAILYLFLAILFAVGAIKVFTTPDVPERYEVVVREGNVIDARQYDIIEQRGQIYVIQAREQSE